MRYREIIEEGRMAPLYHWMDIEKATDVFYYDEMPGHFQHQIPRIGVTAGNSFSRNPNFKLQRLIRITADQSKLAHNHRIIPLDAERIYLHRMEMDSMPPGQRLHSTSDRKNPYLLFAEEFVVGNIKPLHKYITEVLLCDTSEPPNYILNAQIIAKQYCEKWNIPLVIQPEFRNRVKEIKERQKLEYEDEYDKPYPHDITEESVSSPTQYFHVTFTNRVPAIMREGLQLGKRRIWNNAMGKKQGLKAIYLFNDLTMAVRWAHKMQFDFNKPTSILVIDNPPGEIIADDHVEAQMNGRTWFYTSVPIPTSCIKRAIPLTLAMTRQVVQQGKIDLADT